MVMLRPIEAQLADPVAASTGQQPISYPFVVSAKTPRTLLRRAAQLAQWAREATAVDPARLAYTLGLRRTRYPHQIVVQATTVHPHGHNLAVRQQVSQAYRLRLGL